MVSSPVVGGVTDPHHHFTVPTRQTLVIVGDLGTKGLISHRNRGVKLYIILYTYLSGVIQKS